MMRKILRKLFPPKVMWLQSLIATGITKNGKKYLILTKVEKGEIVYRKIFSVNNLLDENYRVTEQTIEQEKKFFIEV